MATPMQGKIAAIMNEANLGEIASRVFDNLASEVADYAEAIVVERCRELGVEDLDSHEANKIHRAAERVIMGNVISVLVKINQSS